MFATVIQLYHTICRYIHIFYRVCLLVLAINMQLPTSSLYSTMYYYIVLQNILFYLTVLSKVFPYHSVSVKESELIINSGDRQNSSFCFTAQGAYNIHHSSSDMVRTQVPNVYQLPNDLYNIYNKRWLSVYQSNMYITIVFGLTLSVFRSRPQRSLVHLNHVIAYHVWHLIAQNL